MVGGIAAGRAGVELGLVGGVAARTASFSRAIVRSVVAQDVHLEQSFARVVVANRVQAGRQQGSAWSWHAGSTARPGSWSTGAARWRWAQCSVPSPRCSGWPGAGRDERPPDELPPDGRLYTRYPVRARSPVRTSRLRDLTGARRPNVIDPSARIHPSADLEAGVSIGAGSSVWHRAQVRNGARIGAACIVGRDAFIDEGVSIGDRVKIQNAALVYHGVTVEDASSSVRTRSSRTTVSRARSRGRASWPGRTTGR